MNREEVQKLIGGYATGTLTPEEQEALFAAALDDQELFDTLAREQALRDLLRDPAAKAHVLAALDRTPEVPEYQAPWYKSIWWRPALVAAAMAGVAAMVVVMTWKPQHPAQPAMVAELKPTAQLKSPESLPAPAPVLKKQSAAEAPVRTAVPRPTTPQGPRTRPPASETSNQPVASASAPAVLPPPASFSVVEPSAVQKAEQQAGLNTPEAAPVPKAPAERVPVDRAGVRADAAPMTTQPAEQGQQGQMGQATSSRLQSAGALALSAGIPGSNARVLFYGNPVAVEASSQRFAKFSTERARIAKTTAAPAKPAAASAFHLGVRCSVLRLQTGGDAAEVGIETVLDAGEHVKLKLIPNDRGYLRVWEQGRPIASGVAQPLQPFEAALPDYSSPGPRQLYIQFTRDGSTVLLTAQARTNLIQTVADEPEKATYVVNGVSDPAVPQLVVPITLNYK